MVIGKACAPGFWRLRRGAGMQYRQPTNVLQFGARRAAYTVYNRPTRVWANAIYQRPTRRIQLTRRIYDRSTRKIHLPNVYARSTRKIQSPLNVYERPTRRIGQQPTPRVNERTVNDSSQKIQHTPEERAMIDEFNIRPCHVVVEKLITDQDKLDELETISLIDKLSLSQTVRTVSSQPQEAKTIFYYDKSLMNGPLSMNRKTYYDIYARNEFFAVDDFNDGTCVRHNFLTRFHPNQYTGLTEKFPRYIYASKITAYLIHKFINVDGSMLRILNPDVPIIVEEVEITAIDVPSYPGALMLVFKDQNGRVEMHGGYMHTSAELEETSTTWNHMEIDSLILHKTPSISKPSSSHDSVFSAEITQLIDEHLAQQLAGLIVFNSYKEIYTMEKFIVSLANSYQLKIWVADNCRHLMAALELENSDVTRLLTRKRHEAAIHILADEYLEVDRLLEYMAKMGGQIHHMLAFRTCLDDAILVSLTHPAHDQYPLKFYNIANVFDGTNSDEYRRFVEFIGIKKSSTDYSERLRPRRQSGDR